MKFYFLLLSVDYCSNPLPDALLREISASHCKVEVTLSELLRYWHSMSTVMSDFYALKNASKINLTTWSCPCCDFMSCLPWTSRYWWFWASKLLCVLSVNGAGYVGI